MPYSLQDEKMLEKLIVLAENLSKGQHVESQEIYIMTNDRRYPKVIYRLAEAFGMMAVKIAAREYHLEQVIADLTKTKDELIIANERLSLDTLTRIPNRWAYSVFLDLEWKRALRFGHSLSAIMIDIDYFKIYNDHYGHIAGDECLCRVAKALHSSCHRSTDILARYGGEEFVAILPETDCHHAVAFAEKLREAVAILAIPHTKPSSGYVTISLGVASILPHSGTTSKQLIDLADQALYDAKHQGRNRVVCHFD